LGRKLVKELHQGSKRPIEELGYFGNAISSHSLALKTVLAAAITTLQLLLEYSSLILGGM
jgi:hypothetical protein